MRGQNFQVFEKNGFSVVQILSVLDFSVQIRNQPPKIGPCSKLQQNQTKDKGSRNSISNDSENGLMTSYTRDSKDVIKFLMLLRDFVPECPSLVVIQVPVMEKHWGGGGGGGVHVI